MLNPNLIKIKSKELDIPYENLLMGCILEETVKFVSSNYKEELWVINDSALGLASYKRSLNDTLILSYSGSEEMEDFVRKLSMSIVSYYMNLDIKVATEFLSQSTVCFRLDILKMRIPFVLVVQKTGELNTFPRERTLMLTLENAKAIHYMEYPLEERISELVFDILDKLELLNEMNSYIDLYDILKTETVEGRKVKECLSGKCEKKSGFDMKRFEVLRSYGDYAYMKKKWKRAVRQAKRDELEWSEVHELIIKFTEPIYKAMLSDDLFFGDWIPEIGRFLD